MSERWEGVRERKEEGKLPQEPKWVVEVKEAA